ncbi:MAG: hypothetical protein COB02_13650 [Candidatus Cloacimonadota bacterium]|nr:MAG: hypothetical protein COB02_13650 [Candidatus Cloacimonadota bacterium]
MNFTSFKSELEKLKFGKKSDTYLLIGCEDFENENLNSSKLISTLKTKLKVTSDFNVLKLHFDQYKICFLKYENFDEVAVPRLLESININLATGNIQKLSYSKSSNLSILLYKEQILKSTVSKYTKFSNQLNQIDFNIQLDTITKENSWKLLLSVHQLEISKHSISQIEETSKIRINNTRVKNYHHKQEILDYGFSQSVLCLLENSLLNKEQTLFDYGCGLENDVKGLQILGYNTFGWDPKTKNDGTKKKADIVNLGNVLSNIEDPLFRSKTLQTAYKYSKSIFIVSCDIQSTSLKLQSYGDGVITSDNKFKKYYSQDEFKQFILDTLGTCEPIALAPGVFCLFKDKSQHQKILKKSCIRSIEHFKYDFSNIEYSDIVKSFLSTAFKLGRAPLENEFQNLEEVIKEIGSIEQGIKVLKKEIGEDTYKQIHDIKRKDLLVYLAVSNFNQRLDKKFLQESILADIESFLDEYDTAYEQALSLLYSTADPQVISTLCEQSEVGFKDEKSLYIRMDQHDQLHPVLRIYIGCCERLMGDISSFDLIKVHKESSKLSLMKYKNFNNDMLPKLEMRIKINLGYQKIKLFNYFDQKHPQSLYHKVRFFNEDHKLYSSFKKHSDKLTELDITIEDHGPNFTDFQEVLNCHGYTNEEDFNLKNS